MDAVKDRYFNRNATGIAIVEFFWGLGFPVVVESTFLQIFLKNLGASDLLIGMVPAILVVGVSVFPLFSSYLTRNHENKKMIVLNLHLISSCSTLFFGIFLFFLDDAALVLPVFFISYLIFSACIGLTFPVWLHFLVKIFSERKNVQGLSIMYIAQNIAKVIASIFIIKVVEVYSFSLYSAAWIFMGSGLVFLIGSLCFLITVEVSPKETQTVNKASFTRHTKETIVEMIQNKNLVKYLISDMDNFVVVTIIAFYANYATQYFGIEDHTAAGLFVCFIYSGSILGNFFLGTLNFLSLKNKFLSTKVICLVTLAVLVYMPTLPGFLLASLLLGICRGIRSIIYSPAVKKFCPRNDTTGYFAVAPLLTLLFASGFPIFFGKMLDHLSYMGSTAYHLMFALSSGIVFITLVLGCLTNFEKEFQANP